MEDQDHDMLRSRVFTFHVEPSHVYEVVDALDRVRERFEKNPDFRGLVCLEGHGGRHQIMVLTMWDGDGLEDMRDEDEHARRQIADTCDLGVRSEEYAVLKNITPNVSLPRTTPYRVVLIDDDKQERALLRTRLEESCRFAVVGEAEDGPAGAATVARLEPDLVALDMSLPGGDAIGTLRMIQTASSASKVVVVSGLPSNDLVHATVDILGASSCFDKNIGADRLVDECLHALEQPGEPYNSSPRATIDREFVIDQRLATVQSSASSITESAVAICARPERPAGCPDIARHLFSTSGMASDSTARTLTSSSA
jgi:DNA-binding NarL/FixJ family response regulator